MSYAVLQTSLELPSSECLQSAFLRVPGVAAADVKILLRDACGVLARGLESAQALTLLSALSAQGIKSELVDDSVLQELPPPKQLTRVHLTPEALQIEDVLGRIFSLAWNDISVIAAGRARLSDFTTKMVRGPAFRAVPGDPSIVTEAVTSEEQKDHLLLEIITCDTSLRYHARPDPMEVPLLFQCLGDRRTKDAAGNLSLLVQEFMKLAPTTCFNRGAVDMCNNKQLTYSYPSKTAFYREITWLLWMVSSSRRKQ